MTEKEYTTLSNRIRISEAKKLLGDVIVCDDICRNIDKNKLKEIIKTLAFWESELFDMVSDMMEDE